MFINAARGGINNGQDLLNARNAGSIWGAGLDETNPEPMSADSLLSMPNVAVLPHIGSSTVEAGNEMSRLAAVNIIEFYKHGNIPNIVNPEAMRNRR
ncbi:MAG: NAD(P)-dependent oxidoreductase [Chitinophagaceae bacterium]